MDSHGMQRCTLTVFKHRRHLWYGVFISNDENIYIFTAYTHFMLHRTIELLYYIKLIMNATQGGSALSGAACLAVSKKIAQRHDVALGHLKCFKFGQFAVFANRRYHLAESVKCVVQTVHPSPFAGVRGHSSFLHHHLWHR